MHRWRRHVPHSWHPTNSPKGRCAPQLHRPPVDEAAGRHVQKEPEVMSNEQNSAEIADIQDALTSPHGPLSNTEDTAVPSEGVRMACDLATGAAKDPTANAISTKGAWRDLNAKGNGDETYRRALSPGGVWRFVSRERLPPGTFLAGDRKASVRGDVYPGDLVADYERSLRGGRSQGEANHDGKVGLVIGPHPEGGAKIEWMDVTRQKDGSWRVILPTGAHLTFASPAWR